MSKSPVTIIVDPGTKTGVAVFRVKELVRSFTCEPPFTELWRTISFYARDETASKVTLVVEEPPQSGHQPETTDLFKQLELADCHMVRPTEWKGHPASRLQQGDTAATKHERDAIGLGRFWLNTNAVKNFAA